MCGKRFSADISKALLQTDEVYQTEYDLNLSFNLQNKQKTKAGPEGFEPPTFGLRVRRYA